tara:strand:+ start:335 stop:547 length:213 start_codon:yes stop_codon:yes gene_type:complete
MNSLDLHGESYETAEELASRFIENNIDAIPIQIITGNSVEMQRIVKNIANKYNLKTEPKTDYNLGCLVIK